MINKFDNYIQSTIIDFRLQDFIWKVYERLPETQFANERQRNTPKFLCPKPDVNNIDLHVKGRKIKINNINETNYEINESNYDIIDLYDRPIVDIKNIKNSKINYADYKIALEGINIQNNIYGIKIRHKISGLVLIVQIGSFSISTTGISYDHEKQIDVKVVAKRKGYYAINIIPENTKINDFGLYSNYYYEDTGEYNGNYISKPLDYKTQVSISSEELDIANIYNDYYYYIAFINEDKFIMKQLLEADKILEEESLQKDKTEHLPGLAGGGYYKSKYLKYKQKYLQLKNSI
jgi:hypothetical protein